MQHAHDHTSGIRHRQQAQDASEREGGEAERALQGCCQAPPAPSASAEAGTGRFEPSVPFTTKTSFSEAEFRRSPHFTYERQQPGAGAEPGCARCGTGGGSVQPLAPQSLVGSAVVIYLQRGNF